MIPISQPLLEAFAPYRSVCSLNDVVVKKVYGVNEAFKILKKLRLPVSKRVIDNRFQERTYYGWSNCGWFTASYDFLEIGTEDLNVKNNIATFLPAMNSIHIHFYGEKTHVGRMHGIKVPAWHECWVYSD